jgi:hypothetical protein
MSKRVDSKSEFVERAKRLKAGAEGRLEATTSLRIRGRVVTAAEITAKLQALIDLRSDVEAAKAAARAKLVVEETEAPELRAFMAAFATYVKAAYDGEPDALADFGIAPKARTEPTVEAKLAAVAKRKATRAARQTLGPRQRLAIKGDVTGLIVTPIRAGEGPDTPA